METTPKIGEVVWFRGKQVRIMFTNCRPWSALVPDRLGGGHKLKEIIRWFAKVQFIDGSGIARVWVDELTEAAPEPLSAIGKPRSRTAPDVPNPAKKARKAFAERAGDTA